MRTVFSRSISRFADVVEGSSRRAKASPAPGARAGRGACPAGERLTRARHDGRVARLRGGARRAQARRSLACLSRSRSYHDAVWAALPAPLQPEHAVLRERFLLALVGRERERLGAAPRVLDVGCGEGQFAAALVTSGAQVVALDAAAEAVRRACAAHPGLDVRLVEPEAELPLPDAGFDVVWAGETIEHVADTAGWLSELRRVLRSGGVLLLSTPDHGPLTRLRLGLDRRAFERSFDPRSEHLRFYTRRSLHALLADFGFEQLEVRGAGGLPGARAVLLASARRSRF